MILKWQLSLYDRKLSFGKIAILFKERNLEKCRKTDLYIRTKGSKVFMTAMRETHEFHKQMAI